MSLGKRIRLCLKDLYQQDIVEMIERESPGNDAGADAQSVHPSVFSQ